MRIFELFSTTARFVALFLITKGSSPALFVGTAAFEVLVKQQIRRLEDPSLKCVGMVYDELIRILNKLLQRPTFKRFPALKDRFNGVVVNFFKKAMNPSNKLVADLIKYVIL
jgi:replication fork clamp-binding protein CrfC